MADLLISVGDYVILQEGQQDQPKIVVWDDLTISESAGPAAPSLNASVFDAIVTEDPVQPAIIQSIALSVFDNVRVQEGQADSDALNASVYDDVALTESVAGFLSLLRVSASDIVTVVDAPEVFSQGPVGVVVFDSVTVQESRSLYILIQINAYDEVRVIDGALNMDVNDAVTVAEDVTIRLARLVITASEDVTVSEYQEVFGPAVNVGTQVYDDIILTEDVTVLLPVLVPTVSSDVTVSDEPTVSLTSINLAIDTSEAVTVTEYLEPQTNPMQIAEFTEVVVSESVTVLSNTLYLMPSEDVTVSESVTLAMSLVLLDVYEDVAVNERVSLRIGAGSGRKAHLPVLGVGK